MAPAPDGDLGRTNDPPLLILTSLASGPRHGYALSRDIEEFAGVTLSPGSLYGAITRLEERGLIEALDAEDRRRPYRLTPAGRQALSRALEDLTRLTDEARTRLSAGDRAAGATA